MVRDFSPAGVGLSVPGTIILPYDFYLTFDYVVRRCITVWRQLDQMGGEVEIDARAWRAGR
jgi:hypothetical protein